MSFHIGLGTAHALSWFPRARVCNSNLWKGAFFPFSKAFR